MGSSAMLDWMRRQLGALNVQLEVRATDYNRFQDKMRNGSAQMYMWGWVADYPDAENFLFLLYGPNAKRSEEHTSELQSLMRSSYAVFCLKKKINQQQHISYILS